MTSITKKYKKRAIFFTFLNWALCFGIAITLVVIAINKADKAEAPTALKTEIYNFVKVYVVALLPTIALAIIVKDKIRPLIWTTSIILSSVLLGNIALYTVFAVWLVDEYIITALAKSSRNRYMINKEIDKRE